MAFTQVEVKLREVAAVHDLVAPNEEAIVGSDPGEPELVFKNPFSLDTEAWVDAAGSPVARPPPLQGVFTRIQYESSSWWPVERTYEWKRSTPIKGKWVYAFAADGPDGSGAHLVHELHCEPGKAERFRRVALEKMAGRDERAAAIQLPLPLTVDAVRFDKAKGKLVPICWFFHLAPYQLPWAAVQEMEKAVASRCTMLGDELFTFVLPKGKKEEAAKPLPEAGVLPSDKTAKLAEAGVLPTDEQVTFVLHLVDPFREGLRRASRLAAALEALEEHYLRLGSDRVYVLAKRIDLLTSRNPGLRGYVETELGAFLGPRQRDTLWVDLRAARAGADLLRWIGKEERRAITQGGDRQHPKASIVFHRGPEVEARWVDSWVAYRKADNAPWTNPFSMTARDYIGAPQEVTEEAGLVVAAVHERLSEIASGRAWLEQNFTVALGERDALADGGAKLVMTPNDLQPKRASKAVGLALKAYGYCFAKRYKEKALSEFGQWLNARWGSLDLADLIPAERSALKAAERREWNRAKRLPLDEVKLSPTAVDVLELTDTALDSLKVGLKAVNAAYATRMIAEDPKDPWRWAEAMGAAAEAYEDYSALAGKPWEIKLYGKFGKLKAIAPLAAATGFLDLAVNLREVSNARDGGERLGKEISAAGSAIALAGAFTGGGLVVTGAVMIASGLQMAGRWIADEFNDAGRFVRNCSFGSLGGLDSLDGLGKHAAAAGEGVVGLVRAERYPIDLKRLKTDTEAQHRALDEILYDFEPSLTLSKTGELILSVRARNPSQITIHSRWKATVEIPQLRKEKAYSFTFAPETFVADSKDPAVRSATLTGFDAAAPKRGVIAKATVSLDVFANPKVPTIAIERRCDGVVRKMWAPGDPVIAKPRA